MPADLSFPLRSTFIALPLEQEAKWQFQALQASLRAYEDCLRFQNPQTPHLTLQFWKEVMEIEFGQLQIQAENVVAGTHPFSLQVAGAETFGSRGEDRVLFLVPVFSEELARLKKRCPWPSDRPFSPHITLARIRHPQRFAVQKKKILKELSGCSFTMAADCLRLYAECGGAKQAPLADFVFRA